MNEWNADPEKYAELSKPFESKEEAMKVTGEFFNAVRKLREQYRIADVVIQFQVYVQIGDDVHAMHGGGGWGDQTRQATLARRAADQEFDHLVKVIERMVAAIPKARKSLITDPTFEGGE